VFSFGNRQAALFPQMLSDSAIVRPAPPRLESTATQHDYERGASEGVEQDIEQISAARWHRQACPTSSVT
jgi:hypothetical protein